METEREQWTEKQVNELLKMQMALVRFAACFEEGFPEGMVDCSVSYYDGAGMERVLMTVPLTLGPGSADVFEVSYL